MTLKLKLCIAMAKITNNTPIVKDFRGFDTGHNIPRSAKLV